MKHVFQNPDGTLWQAPDTLRNRYGAVEVPCTVVKASFYDGELTLYLEVQPEPTDLESPDYHG